MAAPLSGMGDIRAVFATLPDVAKADLKSRLEQIAEAAVLMQQQAAPRLTGNLADSISFAEQASQLRVKAGLTKISKGSKSSRGNFYGIFVEYGRQAGVKFVERRRRVNGKLRLGPGRRKRNEDIATSYLMRWNAMAGRPFIHLENRLTAIIDSIMSGFWDSVIK